MKYAVIKNGVLINIVLAEPEFASQMGWITFPEYVGEKAVAIGWQYDGSNWIAPEEATNTDESTQVTIDVERI